MTLETSKELTRERNPDLVLQELWRIKDELSAACGHDVHHLFALGRERQKHSGHPIVNFEAESSASPPES